MCVFSLKRLFIIIFEQNNFSPRTLTSAPCTVCGQNKLLLALSLSLTQPKRPFDQCLSKRHHCTSKYNSQTFTSESW